jgi:DHA1 family bicyclomycin/chloramphenicol resistance-like MFS transporter
MLGAFSTDTYLPSFPSIAAEFQIGLDVVQQTLTVYLLAMAVMTLFQGTLSDALGRRPVILGGLAIYLGASIAHSLQAVFHSCFSVAWFRACPRAWEWWSAER